MKKLLFILLLSICAFSEVPQVTKPFTMVAGQAAKASEVNSTWDTSYARINMLADTVNRMSTSISTDTAIIDSAKITKAEIDTAQIDSAAIVKADIDTILSCDTSFTNYSKSKRLRADTAIIDSAKITTAEIDSGFFDGTYTLGTAGIGARPKNNKGLIVVDSSLSSEISIITTNSALHSSLYLESDNGEFSSYLRTYGSTASNANEMFLSNPFGTINFYPGDGSPTKTMTIAKDTGVFIYNKLTVDSINILDTGSFTLTLTGCTTSPTGVAKYTKIGNVVHFYMPQITGVSNTTAATLTGLPEKLRMTSATNSFVVNWNRDNNADSIGRLVITNTDTITLQIGTSPTFTAANGKGVTPNNFSYILR